MGAGCADLGACGSVRALVPPVGFLAEIAAWVTAFCCRLVRVFVLDSLAVGSLGFIVVDILGFEPMLVDRLLRGFLPEIASKGVSTMLRV